MKSNNFSSMLLVSLSILLSHTGSAWAASDAEPLQLRKIMQSLSSDMQLVVAATAREDWAQVEQAAARIADHPTPPISEKLRIFAFMGSEMPQFKAHDDKTHRAALALKAVAAERNGDQVIQQFANLQGTCLQCHQNYRTSFRQHFYSPSKMSDGDDMSQGDR